MKIVRQSWENKLNRTAAAIAAAATATADALEHCSNAINYESSEPIATHCHSLSSQHMGTFDGKLCPHDIQFGRRLVVSRSATIHCSFHRSNQIRSLDVLPVPQSRRTIHANANRVASCDQIVIINSLHMHNVSKKYIYVYECGAMWTSGFCNFYR